MNKNFMRYFYRTLAFCTFGFYVHPCCAFECPGHPKNTEEMRDEQRREENNNDPSRSLMNDEQKKSSDEGRGGFIKKD